MPEPVSNRLQSSSIFWDLFLTLLTLYSLKYSLLQFEKLWTFAGPISLLTALLVATWRLKANNESWITLGMFNVGKKSTLLMWTVIALAITLVGGTLLSSLVSSLLGDSAVFTDPASAEFMQNRFANVPGNLSVYFYWLVVSWVIGGFTEELLFRGFLLNRFEKVFSKTVYGLIFAILCQALIFGQLHMYYQGIEGFVVTGILAIVSGLIFIYSKRRLWPLIISHGLANSIGMTMIFLSGG